MPEDPKRLYAIASGVAETKTNPAVLHARIQGRSRDIALDLLDVSQASSDEAIKEAVARFMEIEPKHLKFTVVERYENGNMTLRPEAVFG